MMKTGLMILAAVVAPNVAMAQVEVRLTVPAVRVRVAPPPMRVEVQPERQSPDQVWIGGHWARRGNSNAWIAGVWTRPPHHDMAWEKERWYQDNDTWYYAEGHWRYANPTTPQEIYEPPQEEQEVAVGYAPPRNISERRPTAPFRGAVWIAGYWGWDGAQHEWVAGHWSAPQRGSVWAPDRWRRMRGNNHGESARWVHVPGRWNHRR